MKRYRVTAPDGKAFFVTAPDSATQAQVLDYAKSHAPQTSAAPATGAPQPEDGNSAPSQQRSFAGDLAHQVGLTGRAVVMGVTSLPNMIGDAFGMHSTQAVSHLLDKLGLPRPESSEERAVQSIASGMAGAAVPATLGEGLLKAATPVARGVGKMLAARKGAQVSASGLGGLGSQIASSAGAGPLGQTIAGLGASTLPFGIMSAPSAVRRGIRGNAANADAAKAAAREFGASNVPATPAQLFKTGPLVSAEAYLSHSPGGHNTMRKFAERQAQAVGNAVEKKASELSARSSPMMAGRAIEEGVTQPGGFMTRFKNTSNALFDRLNQYVPLNAVVPVSHTRDLLERLAKPTVGAERTSQLLTNARILDIRQALKSDIGKEGVGIPYVALKELRSRVGELIANTGLTADIPRRQLKALYGAITQDMKGAVEAYGGEEGLRAFERANNYVRTGHARIDDVLQPVIGRDAPEKIFAAATAGTRQGDTTIHAVMQSIPPASQRVVASTVLRMMGISNPGQQNAEGDLFSVSRFLTNWAKMSPEAKRSLFSRFGKDYVDDLNRVANIAEHIRQAGAMYANPSGTAPLFYLQSSIGGAVLAALTGHLSIASSVGGEALLSNISARKITDPRFVHWLAKHGEMPISALPTALNDLSQTRDRRLEK